MAIEEPGVSIGMPSYNCEPSIRQALDSLLAQRYEQFELIVSDDASTDGTWEICRQYAARDPRITIRSNDRNLGATENFRTVLEMARAPYFMWAAGDDVWKPDFISELVGLLELNPTAVLAGCRAEKIDYNGQPIKVGPKYLTTTSMTRAERLRYFAEFNCMWVFYGLYRTKVLRRAFSFMDDELLFKGAGDVLLVRRCIDSGDLAFTDKVLYLKRRSSPESSGIAKMRSFSEMLRVAFRHCYLALFKCYHMEGLTPREIAQIHYASIRGIRHFSFYQIAVQTLRRRLSFARPRLG